MLRLVVLCICLIPDLGFSLPSNDVELPHSEEENAKSESEERIYGGQDADIGEYPSQVAILYTGQFICGGSIISENYILTAAHCMTGKDPDLLKIRVGTNDRTNGTDHKVVRLNIHPNYKSKAKEDIGLIEVSPPIVFNDLVQPAKLPAQDQETAVGSDAIVVGWGRTENGKTTTQLQEGFLFISDHQECHNNYKKIGTVSENEICAGVPEGGIGPCSGDSGGPLYVDGEIVGVASWVAINSNKQCIFKGYPGVFARVSAFRDWINEHLGV